MFKIYFIKYKLISVTLHLNTIKISFIINCINHKKVVTY